MNRGELVTAVQTLLSTTTTSGFYSTAQIQSFVNQANLWGSGLHEWDCLYKKSAEVVTVEDQESYTIPQTSDSEYFREHGIDLVQVETDDDDDDYELYDIFLFRQYEEYKEAYGQDGGRKMVTLFDGKFYVYPTPDTADLSMYMYGYILPVDFSADGDDNFLVNTSTDAEYALVHYAVYLALLKSEQKQEAMLHFELAKNTLDEVFRKQRGRKSMYRVRDGQWTNRDYYGDTTFNML